MVRLFIDSGVDEKRLTETAEGRTRNRRVNVMVLSGIPDKVVELPTP